MLPLITLFFFLLFVFIGIWKIPKTEAFVPARVFLYILAVLVLLFFFLIGTFKDSLDGVL